MSEMVLAIEPVADRPGCRAVWPVGYGLNDQN
jgi:hypothetical protein